MASKRTWANYPATYHAREVAIIAEWIATGESGAIVGPSGTGKSNLLGFLSQRPDSLAAHLGEKHSGLAVTLVDLNNLPGDDLATFYRVILRALYESRAKLAGVHPSLAGTIETLYHTIKKENDPFVSQSALREALLMFQSNDIRLALILDPFDRFAQTASPKILDNLRGLRDSFKGTLSYLVSVRHELAYLRDPTELGELYALLDTHVCWVGGMTPADARWVIDNIIQIRGHAFDEETIERLIELTGGYAALLKAAGLWLTRAAVPTDPAEWLEALLAETSVQNRLQTLWQSFTGEEQLLLTELQTLLNQHPPDSAAYQAFCPQHRPGLLRLQAKRVCLSENGAWRISSPLLAAYIAHLGLIDTGKIYHQETNDVILQGRRSLEQALTPQDRKLLLFFLKHPQKVLRKDEIALALWPEAEVLDRDRGIDDARLQKAVSQLRQVVEKGVETPTYIKTIHGVGYRFFPEGAPYER